VADAFTFENADPVPGTPARQLKQFIDQTGGLWREGKLADKPVTAFTSASNQHCGNEATILSLANVFNQWGLIVPSRFTDPVASAAGGKPYGTSASGPPTKPATDIIAKVRLGRARLDRVNKSATYHELGQRRGENLSIGDLKSSEYDLGEMAEPHAGPGRGSALGGRLRECGHRAGRAATDDGRLLVHVRFPWHRVEFINRIMLRG